MSDSNDLILFDGVCALCDSSVQFILPRDAHKRFRFTSLQSELAGELLSKYKLNAQDLTTFFVLVDYNGPSERLLSRSEAAIHVISHLDGAYRGVSILKMVPKVVADFAYNLVARNRYKLFGKHDTCMMPDAKYADRFI